MKELGIKLLLMSVAVLSPIHAVMLTVGVLIIADLITGVWAAFKSKEEITSARLRDSITKMAIYQIAVVTAFLAETFLLDNVLPVTKIVASVIGVTELKSLLENFSIILNRDLFKELIDKLGSKNR